MKKMLKRGLSIVLSLAMVVTSTTFYNTTAKADEGELYSMMTSATSNLALGCDALSGYAAFSGTEGDLTKLTDGTDNGRVYPQAQKNGSYTVDLGKYYTVDSIDKVVFMYNETNAETWPSKSGGYTISYSQDGMIFYDIKTVTGLTADNWESSGSWSMLDAQDVSDATVDDISCVRYVKVTYPDSYTWGVQLREFAVLNVNNNAEEVTPIAVSKPAGLSAQSNEYNTITGTITAGENQEEYKYNLYLDGEFVLTTVAGEYKIIEVAEGSHTVSVKSLYNGFTSDAVEVTNVDVKDGFKFTSTTTGDSLPTVTGLNDYTNFDYVTATATSGDGSLAIDNNEGTRWESGSSDEQSITVDLKSVYNVKQIDMRWEAANAKDYNVEVSTDGNNFKSVAPVRGASTGGRIDSITFTDAIQARYVRIQGITRNTGYGYSIWEMAVYGEDTYIEPFVLSALTGAYIYNAVDAGKGYQVAVKDGNVFDRVEGDSYSYIVTVNGHDYEVSKSKAYIDLSDAGLTVGEAYTGTIKAKYVAADGTVTESDAVTTAEFTYKDKAVETYDTGVAKVIVNTARTSSTKNINLYQDTSKTKVDSEVIVKGADGSLEANDFATINVRGNTTSIAQKKPYNIKFDSKQNLFGMGKAKKWSLLANCFDKTLMRNQVAFGFHDYLESTHVSGQAYSSMCKPVDLYVDGKYLGSYLLIESVEAGSTRVDIDAENTANTEVLLEIDNTQRDVGTDAHLANVTLSEDGTLASYELYKSGLNMIFTVNEPGEDGTDNMAAYTEYMETYADKLNKTTAFLDDFEVALKSKDYEAIKQYIDIESFVDFYITSELFKTKDIGFSSTRYYIKENAEGTPILYAGPLWDLDLSSGNSGDSSGYNDFFAQTQNPWFGALMAVPEFKSAVVDRWTEILPRVTQLYKKGGDIDQTYAELKKSADANYSLAYNEFATTEDKETGWVLTALYGASHVLGENIHGSSVIYDTYEEYVDEYKTWVKNRVNWLSSQWGVENTYEDVVLQNKDGDITLSWTDVSAKSYDVTYTVYEEGEKTVNVAGTETSLVITDTLANNTDVTLKANYEDGTSEVIDTKTALADLVITGFSFSKKTPIIGDKVSIYLEVKNIGCAVAVPDTDVVSSTTSIDGTQIGWTAAYKDALLPNNIADYNFAVEWTATEGEHTITANIDERGHVVEKSEGNNIFTGTFTIGEAVAPAVPTGLVNASTSEMPYYFTWVGSEDALTYNIYVNGNKVGETSAENFQIDAAVFAEAGTYTVTVTAANEDAESEESEGVEVVVSNRIALVAPTKAYIYNAVDAGKGYQVVFTDKNDLTGYENYTYTIVVTVNGHDYEVSKSKSYIDLSDAELTVGNQYTGTMKAKFVYEDGTVVYSDPVTTSKFTYTEEAVAPYDTGLPQVFVNTSRTGDTENVNLYQDTSKTKVDSEIVVKDAEGNVEVCNFGTFNVRGNTTSMAQKKAYNIKFDSKQNLFGMGSAKKWSLLANCFDKTLMRNQVAFGFHDYLESTHVSGHTYSSQCTPVDLYVDGKYLGSYLLIESVEAGSTRVDIDAENTTNTEVLLEIDNASRDVGTDAHLANVTLDAEGTLASYEMYKSGMGMIFTVNEPGEDGTDNMAAYTEYMETYADKLNKTTAFLDDFEVALKSKDYEAIKQYIDIESFVDFYITSELFKTKDIGYSSTRYYVKENAEGTPILYAGPLWDLDLSSGNSGDSPGYTEFFAQNQNPWFGALMQVPEFKAEVVARWAEVLPTAANLYKKGGAIDQTYAQLKKSADANYSLAYNEFATTEDKETGWVLTALYGASHVLGENIHGSTVIYDTYEEYVDEYKTWVENRVNWLSQQWGVENEYGDVNIKNIEGNVTLSWTDVSADSYDVTYTVYDSENGNTSKTVNVDGTSVVITDILANESTVTVVANTGDDSVELGRTTAYADLDIVDVVFNKKNYVVGDNVSVSLVVKNNGCAVAVPSEDVVSSTLTVDGEQKSYTVEYKGPVNPGENADYSFTMGWNGATVGEHDVQIKVDEREHVTESNEANNIWTGKISVYNAYDLVTTDAKITGFQMSTSLGENNDEIGVRTVYQREELVNEQNVTEFGLVIGLTGQLQSVDEEMILGTDNAYVTSYAATEAGIIDAQMGDSETATYYAMSMPIGLGYDVDYSVRPYAVLEDGSVVYGAVESYNVYAIAKDLYDNNKMSTVAAHDALYEVISAVDPNAEAVDYNWNNTLVAKEDSLEDANSVDVNVEGFQMSASYNGVQGDMGLRIVYSVEGEYEEAGLVYGLVYGDEPITASDMVVGSDNKFVVDYAATEKGLLDCSFGSSTADYYARTMSVSSSKKSNYYTATYYVRAYAKAADGTVKYSGVYSYSINKIADALYQNDLMSTYAGHEALYTNILTRVDENYKEVDYSWDKTLVR